MNRGRLGCLSFALAGLLFAQLGVAQTPVFINEIHYDNTGTDTGEAVEVAGPAGTDLTGWRIVLYNGNVPAAAVTYDDDAFTGSIPDLCGGYGVMVITYLANGIQNGAPDGLALVNSSGTVIQFLSYEGVMTASNGPAAGMTSVNIGVSEGGSDPIGNSLRLSGTGFVYENFTWNSPAAATFGACNTGQVFGTPPPSLSITDVSQAEGNSGSTTFTFTVSLSTPAGPGGVTFDIATADGSATLADSDYVAASQTGVTIAAGGTSTTFDVTVNGDATEELDETFNVNITNASGATIADGLGVGTITNDDVVPHLSITDVTATEGNSGTTIFNFLVTVTSGSATFDITTADNTATTADGDYVASTLTSQNVTAGTPYTFAVTVNGDSTIEPDETFFVNITNVSAGVTVDDAQGLGTITNDDTPILSINDVSVSEGNAGTVTATFTVTLAAPAGPGGVTFDIATTDGTATTADNDYIAASQTGVTIAETGTSATFGVTVNGDTSFEDTETFSVDLTNITGATAGDTHGLGTITNDDSAPSIVINEILADPASGLNGDANGDGYRDSGSAQDEFVELVNASGADLDISGWTLWDATASARHTFPAGTIVTNNCGIVVFGGGTPTGAFGGSTVQVASSGQLGLNNGGDTVSLKLGTTTVATYTYGAEGGNDQSLTRNPDITGPTPLVQHATVAASGGARFSPGKLLTGYPFSGCTIIPTVAEIFDIQGSGLASPYSGGYVTTNDNVVTALDSSGFFIQTPDIRADASADTSNAIYVYTNSAPTVLVGDIVNVTGEVKEYFNFTEISFPTVTGVGNGAAMPTAIEFNATRPDTDPGNPPAPSCTIEYECWEGMRIHIANGLVSGPNQSFGTDPFAEMYAVGHTNRPFRTPGIRFPGLPGLPIWDGNPDVFELDPNRLGLTNDVMPVGTTFSATGVLGYEFSGWELWPTELSFDAPPVLPRAVRPRTALEMTVGSLNLLNYDSTAGDYAVRTAKHSQYVRIVLGAPDVLGVAEVENLVTLQGLADAIHTDDPSLTYTAVLGPVDKSGIDVGFLVRDTVAAGFVITQYGATEVFPLDGSLLHDRPPLLLEGSFIGNGAPFSFAVMINHTRSFIDIDAPDPLGNRVRQKRLAQAQSIAGYVQAYQTAHPTTPFTLVGDYNAYEFTDGYVDVIGQISGDAVQADNLVWAANITTPVLTKQVLSVPAADRYSYVFEGTSQVIDHALTTQFTNIWARGMAFGRGNSDAAEQFVHDGSTVLRGSDHDGLVLYLMTDGNGNGIPDDLDHADLALTKLATPDPVLTGGTLTYTLTASNAGPDAAGPTTVIDTLPSGVTFGSATGTGWSCDQNLGVVTCTAAALAVGTAPDITITVTVTATSGTLTNTAVVSSSMFDPNPADNTATTNTAVTELTDLSVAMSANPTVTAPSETFTHSATVTNLGPSDASGVILTITLPAGAIAGTITPGACVAVDVTVTCTIGPLARNATFAASIDLTAVTSGTYTSTGVVAEAELDPVPANNTASATTSVGQIIATPSPVNMRVPVFSLGSTTLNITNDSPLAVSFSLPERRIEYAWARFAVAGPAWQIPSEHSADTTARAVPQHELPSVAVTPLTPTATLDFATGLVSPWGIGFNTTAADMWINDIAALGGDGLNHRFLAAGTATGDTIEISSWVGTYAADMTYDPFANRLWQVNVGGDNCIHELNPASMTSTGNTICPAPVTSQRGLAFDPVTDTFFAGSWNDGAIHRFDRTGAILETVNAGLDVSGLAYNPSTGHLFVLTNTDAAADLYVLDVNNAYTAAGSFKIAGMGAYEQAGIEADCAGNLYAVNQATAEVLVVPSGETGFCDFMIVPWLDETPKSGTIAAGDTQAVTLDFITALQWPGLHRASLRVAGTDPFAPIDVPINYTIAFLDVPAGHWADAFIHGLAGVRVTRGCGDGYFCPDAGVSRAEMAILMVRAMHGPLFAPPAATGIFVDVPISDSDSTADYVEQLYHDGIVAGCAVGGQGELYYCPTDLVNRAQMAVFVSAGISLPPVNPPTGYFTDVHGTGYAWAEGFVEAIFNEGITAGCGDHLFCPADSITRAQLAVWLVAAFDFPYLPPTIN